MSSSTVTLPDGSKRQYSNGTSYFDIAKSIGPGLAKAALAAKIDGAFFDMDQTLERDVSLAFVTGTHEDGLNILRHSTSHVLAMAVQKLWPGTQVTIGPTIENGFYYDFQFAEGVKINEADFEKIEKEMQAIIKSELPIRRQVLSKEEAIKLFKELRETFKVELIEELPAGEAISVYKIGGVKNADKNGAQNSEWVDLCRGPHAPRTSMLGAFKLTSVAGSYWRGDEKKARLTRIYGTAFSSKKDLDAYLNRMEEAKKRDHRVLGKQLDLFSFHIESPANVFLHPKGFWIYNKLINYMRKSNQRYGFKEVGTPLIMNVELWHRSGHYDNYRDNMYFTKVDDMEAAVKPMNCPGHLLIYKNDRRSYRDLPIRFSEFGRVHRHERSGVTHGMTRVRSFVQDDAHVFCTPDQVEDELKLIIRQINETFKTMGFTNIKVELSTRPAKYIGELSVWEKAESILAVVLEDTFKDQYRLNPGDGAFYGPKIDFHLTDSIGRSWQCSTVQLDFSMPLRFGLEFQGPDDKPYTPVMLHRTVLGSIERFFAIFIEHHAGHFPLWAAPTQVRVLNITDSQTPYAKTVVEELQKAGLSVDIDTRNEKLGFKVREAQLQKIPYMVIVGDKEATNHTVTPRLKDGSNLESMSIDAFVDRLKKECGELWGL